MSGELIEVENGEKVEAVRHPGDSDITIIFCHGFGSNKEGGYEERAERTVEEGFNAVRFDFRGNGGSDGNFIDQDLSSKIKDLQAVLEHYSPERYILFGSSFGGKVIFHSDLNPEAIIVKAPMTYNLIMNDYREEVEKNGRVEKIPGKPVQKGFFEDLDLYKFDQLDGKIESPVLIFHGDTDKLVNIENSFEAAEHLETDLSLFKLRDEGHSFSDGGEEKMKDHMFSWLRNVL